MAFASTRIGAQEAIIHPCDLCEDDEDVNWFCKDCDQSLCDRCKRSHLRSNVSKSHVVLSISEGFEMGKKNISNICVDHGAPFQFICRTCNRDICPSCLSIEHKKHDFFEIRKLESEMERRLDRVIKVKEDEMRKMTRDFEDLDQYVNESETYLKERCSYIDDKVKAMKLAADDEGQNLKDRLRANVEQGDKDVREYQNKIHSQSNAYENEIKTVKRELRLQNPSSLTDFVKASISKLELLRPMAIKVPDRSRLFSEGHFDQNKIREMIGILGSMTESINEVEESAWHAVSDLEVIKLFQLDNDQMYCNCFCLSPDGSIWIGGNNVVRQLRSDCSSELHRIRIDSIGQFSATIVRYAMGLSHSKSVNSIACLHPTEVVVCHAGHVLLISSEGLRREFTNLYPRKAYGITFKNEHVFINVDREYIAIFSKEGNHVKDIKVDEGISTFCTDMDGNVIIAHPNSSTLSLLDGKSGHVKTRWPVSTPDIMHLACDRYGNILASNKEKNIFFFSKNGKVTKTFTLDCDDMRGICLNADNHLIVLLTKDQRHKMLLMKYLRKEKS